MPVVTRPPLSGIIAPSSGLPPDQISGLFFWWKADALSLSNDDPVASWDDSSGNGHTLSQGTAGSRPLYKTNIINGKPAVLWDGSDDKLVTTAGFTTLDQVFVVCQYNAATFASFAGLIDWFATSLNDSNIILTAESGTTKFYNSTEDEDYAKNGTAFADNDMQAPMNTFAVVQNIVPPKALDTDIILGSDRDAASRVWDGYIAEVCGYDNVISSEDAALLRQYFYSKYGFSGD